MKKNMSIKKRKGKKPSRRKNKKSKLNGGALNEKAKAIAAYQAHLKDEQDKLFAKFERENKNKINKLNRVTLKDGAGLYTGLKNTFIEKSNRQKNDKKAIKKIYTLMKIVEQITNNEPKVNYVGIWFIISSDDYEKIKKKNFQEIIFPFIITDEGALEKYEYKKYKKFFGLGSEETKPIKGITKLNLFKCDNDNALPFITKKKEKYVIIYKSVDYHEWPIL